MSAYVFNVMNSISPNDGLEQSTRPNGNSFGKAMVQKYEAWWTSAACWESGLTEVSTRPTVPAVPFACQKSQIFFMSSFVAGASPD